MQGPNHSQFSHAMRPDKPREHLPSLIGSNQPNKANSAETLIQKGSTLVRRSAREPVPKELGLTAAHHIKRRSHV